MGRLDLRERSEVIRARCVCFRVESAIVQVATDADVSENPPGQEHKSVRKVKQKARAFLQEMVANISPAFIR